VELILIYLAGMVGTILLGLVSKWIDRKATAMVQWRVGPPWYQPFADVAKLLGKETLVPETATRSIYLAAPLVGLAGVLLAAAVLWVPNLVGAASPGFVGDFIAVLYLTALPALALVIGGTAAGSSISALGASREMKMVLSYELPLILSACVPLIKTAQSLATGASFRLSSILEAQAASPFILSISGIIAFIVALLCIQAKLGLVPFDAAEAETEIIAGPYTEYSGTPFAMFYLTRAAMLATMPLFLITLFWGGIAPGWASLWSVGKYVLIVVLIVLIRNTNPRLRIDQAMKFFWYAATPLAVVAVLFALLGW
jgi:NADH-quinone oxidoreductase subunit H